MISGQRQKFCEGIITGLSATDAYLAAYPRSKRDSAKNNASRLLTEPEVRAQLTALRSAAEKAAGSSILRHIEKRKFLARVVRARISELPDNSDLLTHRKLSKDIIDVRIPDKLRALALDNDLAGVDHDQTKTSLDTIIQNIRSRPYFQCDQLKAEAQPPPITVSAIPSPRPLKFTRDKNPRLTPKRLAEFESRLARPLPYDYRNFLLDHNGGVPERRVFHIPSCQGDAVVDHLFGIDYPGRDLPLWMEVLQPNLEDKWLALGLDPKGNALLLHLADGTIHYWDNAHLFPSSSHEKDTYLVANSFTAFLESLRDFQS